MKKKLLLLCCLVSLGGCAGLQHSGMGEFRFYERSSGLPSIDTRDILTCLDDTRSITRKQFDETIILAEKDLENGLDKDRFRFICLSLNEKADYEQFKHGAMILEQYLEEHADSAQDLRGFNILVEQLDNAIKNKWTSWKTLLKDKKALKAEVTSLRARVEELQKQIDQLKNIENIIKSRE